MRIAYKSLFFGVFAALAALGAPAFAADQCQTVDDVRGAISEQASPEMAASFKLLSDADYASFSKAVADHGFQMPDGTVAAYAAVGSDGFVFVVSFDANGCETAFWNIPPADWAAIFG